MKWPADETQPLRTHSATLSSSRSPSFGSLTGITLEPSCRAASRGRRSSAFGLTALEAQAASETFFLGRSGIGPLLDLEQHQVLQRAEAVATGDRDQHVAGGQLAGCRELARRAVDVDLAAP